MPTVCSFLAVTVIDQKIVDFLKHAGTVTGFFILNLLAYEFIVMIAAIILVLLYNSIMKAFVKLPFVKIKEVPEHVMDGVMYFAMRASIIAMIVLMVLWVLNIYRLIPIP